MKTRKKVHAVFVAHCERCHLNYYTLTSTKAVGECSRCHNTFLPVRVIAHPHPDTLARATRGDVRDD